ncbi:hypothetical protein [Streptomyces scopuliridis]|uniref:hypothetical protein n=1 Tax=Streptomyces scopuliridis TaxID=452529 RepID=UPI0035D9F465
MSYPNLLTPTEKLAQGKAALGIRDIVVLCGSMRFADAMAEVAIEESVLRGALVLKPDCNMKVEHPLWVDPAEAEALKVRLDDQHRQKIRLADRVIVVGDYIGDSTRGEIAYARELGKPVAFTHPEVDPAAARQIIGATSVQPETEGHPDTDRAAILREAADAVWAMDYEQDANDYGFDSIRDAWDGGTMDASKYLRRMADEAQQPTAGEQAETDAPYPR